MSTFVLIRKIFFSWHEAHSSKGKSVTGWAGVDSVVVQKTKLSIREAFKIKKTSQIWDFVPIGWVGGS